MFDLGTLLTAAVAAPHRPCARLLALDTDGTTLRTWEADTGVLLDAGVTYDRASYIRRSGAAEIVNTDGALSPQEPGDLFYPGARFRLERGAWVSGSRLYAPLGTFVVTGYSATMTGHLRITGEDPTSLLAQPFGEVVSLEAGTPAATALRTLWAPVLDPDDDGEAWDLDDGGRTVPLRVFLEDDDRLAAGVELMADLGLQAFADRLGVPVLRPVPDPTDPDSVTVVREFAPGVTSVMLDLERSGDRRPYNRVIVDVVAPDRDPIRAIVSVTDPASPLHEDRIGVQTAPVYRTAQTADQAAANAVGLALLTEYALSNDRVRSSIIPDLSLDEEDVVSFDEDVSGTSDRYRIDRISHPVLTGPSSIEASRVLPVVAA